MPLATADLRAMHRLYFGRDAEVVTHAPGRISLLGGHADYNEGFVLPVAIALYTHATISARDGGPDGSAKVRSANLGESCSLTAEAAPASLPAWARYLHGVVAELAALGHRLPPFDLLVHGELPIGSGLSSSASMTVAAATAVDRRFRLGLDGIDLVRLCRRAEERHAGVGCGVMDPFAACLGRQGRALFIDCRTLEHEEIPIAPDLRLLVLDSGVRRTLAGSEFMDRRRECDRAVHEIRNLLGEPITALRDVSAERLLEVIDRLPSPLRLRAAHVVSDLARAVRGVEALQAGRHPDFGEAMFETHASLRDLYEVSIPELDLLVEIARATPGVIGARLTGAGFGGCVSAVASEAAVPRLREALASRFRSRFGSVPTATVYDSADGAWFTAESVA
jgi:galactokinase